MGSSQLPVELLERRAPLNAVRLGCPEQPAMHNGLLARRNRFLHPGKSLHASILLAYMLPACACCFHLQGFCCYFASASEIATAFS